MFCIPAAEAVVADPGSLCVVIGGSGNGEQIAANKVTGARAALAYDLDTAKLGRQHNDANVISHRRRGCTPRRRRWSWSGCSWPPRSAATSGTPAGSGCWPSTRTARG